MKKILVIFYDNNLYTVCSVCFYIFFLKQSSKKNSTSCRVKNNLLSPSIQLVVLPQNIKLKNSIPLVEKFLSSSGTETFIKLFFRLAFSEKKLIFFTIFLKQQVEFPNRTNFFVDFLGEHGYIITNRSN